MGVVYSLVDSRWLEGGLNPVLSLYTIPISLALGLAILFLGEKLRKTLRSIFLLSLAIVPVLVFNDVNNFMTLIPAVWLGWVGGLTVSFGAGAIMNMASSVIFFAQMLLDSLVPAKPMSEKKPENAAPQKT